MTRAYLLAPALLATLAGCVGQGSGGVAWDGRRGYDGNGDYGYDIAASESAAQSYRARAARYYPKPGPPGDPWRPYITEAANRFGVPDTWIRAVMRQESGGRLEDADGSLITSYTGAMGLMQIMPQTWAMLQSKYGLGADPYEPHDNILAGAAYIREMYDRFGAPAFLAAYNAGPMRVDSYLAGTDQLPDETVNYVAAIGPRIGMAGSFGGGRAYASHPAYGTPPSLLAISRQSVSGQSAPDPLDAAYEGGGAVGDDAAYAGGGMTGMEYQATRGR